MPGLSDIRTGRKILRTLLHQRSARRATASALAAAAPIAPGSIRIGVYFADDDVNLYQVRQWYAPLVELAKTWPVAILSRDARATAPLLAESPLPVAYVRTVEDLEQFVATQDLRIVLYVNQNSRNFQMFRYARMWHVFVNHGESDKMYMTTNQFKAYDYALVAGAAARARLSRELWDYDLDARTMTIGRPQADHFAGALPYTPDDRTVVLYAPTWEGDRPAALYGSIASHGEALVAALLASGRHRVIYRPHPRSGVIDPEYAAAHKRIVAAIAAANAADATGHHVYDDGPTMGWQLVAADVAITDISAMVYDRLATGKPIVVARPAAASAEIDEGGFLSDCEWLTTENAPRVVEIMDRLLTDTDAQAKLGRWVEHYFGDTTPGEGTRRFGGAIGELMQRWELFAARERERA
jgi:hypothetical protein